MVKDLLTKSINSSASILRVGPLLLTTLSVYALWSYVAIFQLRRESQAVSTERESMSPISIPRLVIFRRSHKTASTSMAAALLEVLEPLGYIPIQLASSEIGITYLYSNLHNPRGRPVFLFSHNNHTRRIGSHNHHETIIIDTFRDGYQQITSFCRAKRRIANCDDDLADCLENDRVVLRHLYYRWAGRAEEDEETFIDVPLSTKHAALSTTALRTIFPDAILKIDHFREKNSTCPEHEELRHIYRKRFAQLDEQVEKLSRRLLILTGYPHQLAEGEKSKLTLSEMLDVAESLEQRKYDLTPPRKAGLRSFRIEKAASDTGAWSNQHGTWTILPSANMGSYNTRKSNFENENEYGLLSNDDYGKYENNGDS